MVFVRFWGWEGVMNKFGPLGPPSLSACASMSDCTVRSSLFWVSLSFVAKRYILQQKCLKSE